MQSIRRAPGKRRKGSTISTVLLTIAIWREAEHWLSECVELGIRSFGSDPEDAAEQAMDAVCSYLNTLEEIGERERVFAEKSIGVYTGAPAEVHLAHLSREMVARDGLQIRPFEAPLGSFA
ncbi:MAG: hypothetical protein Q7S35_07410 [Candidatus Limnocylindrales bacterium]|nr:hypothetical protein [Candidatus Limnocylindrales bacterium]